jgi:hypothetical protein
MNKTDIEGLPGSDALFIDSPRKQFRDSVVSQSNVTVDSIRNISIPGPQSNIPLRVYTPENDRHIL